MTDATGTLVERAYPHSDMRYEELRFLADTFLAAHKAAPGGLSIEVGTRHGGSAYLMLLLLERHCYEPHERPMLFTVDPYGDKPYMGGDVSGLQLYGNADYLQSKRLLAPFANHAHWYCEGRDFLDRAWVRGETYWWRGQCLPIGNFTFVLLDGDHDAKTVCYEARAALSLLAPAGAILVDNVDKDPFLLSDLQAIRGALVELGPPTPPGARQAIIRHAAQGLQ